MSLDEITFTLSDPDGRLSIDTLKGTIEKAMNMLRSMEADFVAAGQSVRWEVVRVQRQSPFKMTVAPIVAGKRNDSRRRAFRL